MLSVIKGFEMFVTKGISMKKVLIPALLGLILQSQLSFADGDADCKDF